jgi:putative restriction endonuclease
VAEVLRQPPRMTAVPKWADVAGLDRNAVTRVRVNQHLFRTMVLASYGTQCAVYTLPLPSLLVASHIIGWAVDTSLRMNPQNGICLCATHDRAFECGLLLVRSDYTIALHQRLAEHKSNPAVYAFLLAYAGKPIRLPERWHPNPELLARHEAQFTVA